jgi:beta-N-acetylhexosaminidase
MVSGQGEQPPRRMQWGARARWIVVLLGISFLVLRGAVSAGTLLGQANINVVNVPTVALPTPILTQPLTAELYAKQLMNNMSFNDKVAQMLMMDSDGTQLDTDQQQMVEQQHVGGAVLFNSNVQDGPQLTQLTRDMQRHARFPLFTAIDQEGGNAVNRLQDLVTVTFPGEPDIGQVDTVPYAQNAGTVTSTALTSFGLNFNLAPVVDVQLPGIDSIELHDRLYSSDPNVVANMADAYLAGLQQSGKVVGVLKHFPGLGATPDNPDQILPVVDLTRDQLDQAEFVPYKKLIAGHNVRVIMVTHILLTQIDNQLPATLSYADTTGLLRQHLGYQGIIITDDLRRVTKEAGVDIATACLMAAKAGADILMGPISTDEVNKVLAVFNDALTNDSGLGNRVNQSVTRILTLKIQMGLIPLPKIQVTVTPAMPQTPTPPTSLTPTPQALVARQQGIA